jgi:hypothetical protein
VRKKIQVFVSSTFLDLRSEREVVVQAVLDAGHIPAGMELFRAGNESQLDTVKKWIRDSDVFLLIFGGRYGSIEPLSKKSYTQVEYEYAESLGIPVFSLVLSESFLYMKAAEAKGNDIFETEHIDLYQEFKQKVMSKTVRIIKDEKELQIEVLRTLPSLTEGYDLAGWVRGLDVQEYEKLREEKIKLLEENIKLHEKIKLLEGKIKKSEGSEKKTYGDYSFEELKQILSSQVIEVPVEATANKKKAKYDAYVLFMNTFDNFSTGIEDRMGMSAYARFLFYNLAPTLLSYGLLERV